MKCAVLHASAWVIEERLISAALILTKAAQVCLFAPVQLKKKFVQQVYMSLSSNHRKTWSSWELPFLFFCLFPWPHIRRLPWPVDIVGQKLLQGLIWPNELAPGTTGGDTFCWKVILSFILMFVDIGCCSTVPGRGDTSLRSMMKMSRYDKTINLCL